MSAAPSPICQLLTWQNPAATGKVFGSLIASLLLVKINVVNHLFHIGYIALLVAAAAEYTGKLATGQGFVTKYVGTPKAHSQAFKDSVLPSLGSLAEALEGKVHKVVYAQDIEATLKAAGVSYILYKLTSWFSVYSLIFASVVLAFTGPFVYQMNKKEIDAAVAQYSKIAKDKSSEYINCAQTKAAPHIDAFIKKSGPVGSFIQSKFPTRTAGSTVGTSATTAAEPVSTEPTTAYTSGSSQFPKVPSSRPSATADETVVETTEVIPEPSL